MELQCVSSEDFSHILKDIILEALKKDVWITLPSGDTPAEAYRLLVEDYKKYPFEIKATIVGLDEWLGLDVSDEGSCQYYMHRDVYDHLPLKKGQLIEFDAKALDPQKECERMDRILTTHHFSLVVLGIGMNGHLGLNEPGASFDQRSHVVNLDEHTKCVAQKYFKERVELQQGITLGIAQFLESDELILIANGERKKEIIKAIIDTEPNEKLPASVAKLHKKARLLIDQQCAY